MRRITTYQPTIVETALLILDDVVTGAVSVFYPHPYYHAFCAHRHRRSLYPALQHLERRYLVGARRRSGRAEWYLTAEGVKLVQRLKAKLAHARQGRWDGKWRLVVFDVPERIRDRRNFLRRELMALGFSQLQKSVWVTPYPLPEDFSAIVAELGLGKHFRIITADAIRDDRDLRSFFFPQT